MPNLREESPSKIAAGFGGTLNLVVSTLFILVVVLLTALPSHFYLGYEHSETGELVGVSSRGRLAPLLAAGRHCGQRVAGSGRDGGPPEGRFRGIPADGVLRIREDCSLPKQPFWAEYRQAV